jgi:pantoate--beta-alanine ligase
MAVEMTTTVAECRRVLEAARARGASIGLVPTMGALHAGHRSLIAAAAAGCDVVVVSIFVNPLQFGDPTDIAAYPRTLERDLAVCTAAGAHVVFAPSVTEMYPAGPDAVATTVSVSGVSTSWEGASRPGHFDGVATVVAKLFSIAGPCRAYFGQKDFQQLSVVRRMATDLCLPVTVIGCPTIRETDGLALSSRNVRLSSDERRAAVVLSLALAAAQSALAAGVISTEELTSIMRDVVATEPGVTLDYAVAVDGTTLIEPAVISDAATVRLLIAAIVGPVRLIDNAPALSGAPAAPLTSFAASPRRESRQLERIG